MNKADKACIKVRILQLARLKSTGSPSDLAVKMEISERSVKRIVRELRDEGNNIKYDYHCMSYVLGEKT
jgi:biotin operon repressor